MEFFDVSVIHCDGTSTAAKKGGDNLGHNGNVITPFISAPGNRNESPLFREELPKVLAIARQVGFILMGSLVSLDGVYDGKANRKAIFHHRMRPNIPENPRNRKKIKPGPKRFFDKEIFAERFRTIERVFAWEDKFKRLLLLFEQRSEMYA